MSTTSSTPRRGPPRPSANAPDARVVRRTALHNGGTCRGTRRCSAPTTRPSPTSRPVRCAKVAWPRSWPATSSRTPASRTSPRTGASPPASRSTSSPRTGWATTGSSTCPGRSAGATHAPACVAPTPCGRRWARPPSSASHSSTPTGSCCSPPTCPRLEQRRRRGPARRRAAPTRSSSMRSRCSSPEGLRRLAHYAEHGPHGLPPGT